MLDLTDRSKVFYWQTDRTITPEEYKSIFLDRHTTPDEELLKILKQGITVLPTDSLELIPADENVIKGNVNIVRKISIDGKQYVVRMHPKGVKNGYFYVEKVAMQLAKKQGLPVAEILEVHEAKDVNDMDFVVMTVLPGMTMDVYLSKDKTPEQELLHSCGKLMAKIHDIRVEGFGPFSNTLAKTQQKLKGIHNSNTQFMHTALEENFERIIKLTGVTKEEVTAMKKIMDGYTFEPGEGPILVHNDFADWNVLTDGKTITGVLDWDECYGGDPIADLACWSMFFNLERFTFFLEGYRLVKQLPEDFEKRFHYYRLRYAISKVALRAKRALVDDSIFATEKLTLGKKALATEVEWFTKNG